MTRIVAGMALVWTVGCSGDGDKDGTTPETCPSDLTFADANNYSFVSDFQIGSVDVAPESDLQIDWSGVGTDIRGRSVDPNAVEQLILVEFNVPRSEVLNKINVNDIAQSDTLYQYLWQNNASEDNALVSAFDIVGNPMDLTQLDDDPNTTWLLSMANIVNGRFDFLMNTFVVPTTGETNTAIVFDDDSAQLDFDVDLQSADALCSAPNVAGTTIDWSGVTNDAYGRPLDLALVNNLVIGHVAEENLDDVEELFLRLYEEADQVYDLDVNSLTFADLSGAVSRLDGTSTFGGFTADGTWVVAIECTRQECTNPAPLLLAVIEVE